VVGEQSGRTPEWLLKLGVKKQQNQKNPPKKNHPPKKKANKRRENVILSGAASEVYAMQSHLAVKDLGHPSA